MSSFAAGFGFEPKLETFREKQLYGRFNDFLVVALCLFEGDGNLIEGKSLEPGFQFVNVAEGKKAQRRRSLVSIGKQVIIDEEIEIGNRLLLGRGIRFYSEI